MVPEEEVAVVVGADVVAGAEVVVGADVVVGAEVVVGVDVVAGAEVVVGVVPEDVVPELPEFVGIDVVVVTPDDETTGGKVAFLGQRL